MSSMFILLVTGVVLVMLAYEFTALLQPTSATSATKTPVDRAIKSLCASSLQAFCIINRQGKILHRLPPNATLSEQQVAYLQAHPGMVSARHREQDAPPNVRDLYTAALTCQSQLVLISPHYVYTVRPRNGWKSNRELEAALNKYQHLCESTYECKYFMGYNSRGNALAQGEIELELTEEAMRAIATELDYEYARSKR